MKHKNINCFSGGKHLPPPLFISLFCFVLLITSCAREEILDDIQSEHFQPQLVVHSVISPGDSILVNVGRSIPLGDSIESSKVPNALVTLANEQGDKVLLKLVQSDYYTSVYGINQQDFAIEAGNTYTLLVAHPTLPEAKAICTVPAIATPLVKVEYLGESSIPDDVFLEYDVRVSWYDDGQQLHRVYFEGKSQKINSRNGSLLEEEDFYKGYNPIHGTERTEDLFAYQESFFSGGVHYTNIDTLPDGVISIGGATEAKIIYYLNTYLVTPDEHMARYQESLDVFARNRDALGSNSFVELYRGIIPEYSNVRGGLGVFGAYLRSEPVYLTLE